MQDIRAILSAVPKGQASIDNIEKNKFASRADVKVIKNALVGHLMETYGKK